MVKVDNPRSSALVPSCSILKVEGRAQDFSDPARHQRNNSTKSNTTASSTQLQMTPPGTPDGSQEDLSQQVERPPVFHNFLRAFYPFHPTYAVSDTTVTLPLNEGDVVLVHSIHTNGWADGTLLISGARGWLPTNYCEAYDPEPMRTLLQALLNFWELMRSGQRSDAELLGNQEFMRGIIAGVRYLLEKSHCLTRESPLVQNNDGLRRNRKALLSELSALVKAAKRLQEFAVSPITAEDVNEVIEEEMVLKAFKIVTKGVRFLDILEEDRRRRQPLVNRVMETVVEESYIPPTPPADSTSFEVTQHGNNASNAASRRTSNQSTASSRSNPTRAGEQSRSPPRKRSSLAHSNATTPERHMSRSGSVAAKRPSVSHRLSMTLSAAQRHNLVFERLNASHDNLLSYLGSFIGRLHLQSQSTADLLVTIKHSVTAGRAFLTVVEAVCARDAQSADTLDQARGAMYDRINKLVVAARDIIKASGLEEDDVVMPHENGRLLMAATGCVKAAGECVAKTKIVLDRIGDFEFEGGLSFDLDPAPHLANHASPGLDSTPVPASKATVPPEPTNRPPPPPLIIPSYEKPLPQVPVKVFPDEKNVPLQAQPPLESVPETQDTDDTSSMGSSFLPPLPKLHSPLMAQDDYSPTDRTSTQDGDHHTSFRSGSIAISSIGTTISYFSSVRGSESSMLSQTSTRATTPDLSGYAPRNKDLLSEIILSGSHSTITDDMDEGESRMLEKTFAHQLMYNKEGQITGGTLPALVERLTTHDSTPDAMFVSTFYLTFRLFATPVELARALVDRFDYVADSPHIAPPVRLRVYNVFKGWLESHWKRLVDQEALSIIEPFAQKKLLAVLPPAGHRLLELASKVSSTDGPLVPRLVSSMGKTNTSISQYIPADTPLPASNLSKAQTAALKNWKMGGSSPDILIFDPLELARQLTIKEMNIFCAIMPDELLGSEWTKRSGSNAVNVRAMSTLSTDLSNLVADTILYHDDFKKRAVTIKHWIKIAHKCLELNNYDSLMAIICTLNSSTIIRLKATWAAVSPRRRDMLKVLQAIVEPDKNYAVLRRRLHDHVPPCLPFVGTYLTDLTFVDAGNPATKQLPGLGDSDGIHVINFDKHTRTAKIIGELQRFQIPYRLIEVPELQEWIQAQIVRVKSSPDQEQVQQFYRKSLLLEPRDSFTRPSLIDHHSSFSSMGQKEKFDIFGWTHLREKQIPTS